MVVETTAGSLKEEEVMSAVLPPKDIEMESSAPFHSSEVMDENTVPQFVAQSSELESESRGLSLSNWLCHSRAWTCSVRGTNWEEKKGSRGVVAVLTALVRAKLAES